MQPQWIFIPVLVQIFLTLYAYIALAVAKKKAIAGQEVNEGRRALYDDAWPESVIKINNNIRNQFELPVLFYVLTILLWATHSAHIYAQVIAWLFVATRIVHMLIHTGSNTVPLRRQVFSFGCLMILILAVMALVAIL